MLNSFGLSIKTEIMMMRALTDIETVKNRSSTPDGSGTIMIAIMVISAKTTVRSLDLAIVLKNGKLRSKNEEKLALAKKIAQFDIIH